MPALIKRRRIDAKLLTAGQPWPEQFTVLKNAGIETVINLSADTSSNYLADEAARWRELGIDYAALPIPWQTPSREHAEKFFRLMDARRGRHTLVHCALNMRESALVYLYRVLHSGVAREAPLADLSAFLRPASIGSS